MSAAPARRAESVRPADPSRPGRRRAGRHRPAAGWRGRTLLALLLVGVAVAVAAVAVRPGPAARDLTAEDFAAPLGVDGPAAAPGVSPLATGAVVTPATPVPTGPVLRLSGAVPSAGRGSFDFDDRPGSVLGRAGALQRYRVAVERGADEDVAAFGTAVQDALGDAQSWIGSGRLRLQRVPAGAAHDFTVYLATPATAGRLCAAGGVNIRVGGRPYTSCRAPGKVIINLERWRLSVPHFVGARVPLDVYRTYVINHEVGHQLGHRHERCPGSGRPAPVMMQQTLFLRGCVANPWPYRNGRRYAGPPL